MRPYKFQNPYQKTSQRRINKLAKSKARTMTNHLARNIDQAIRPKPRLFPKWLWDLVIGL